MYWRSCSRSGEMYDGAAVSVPVRESKTLRDAWDENAADWVRWARSPELDHAFWHLNLPAAIALLPAPGGLTLDVGCGEGRVARELKELGHRVVGIDSSPALVTAAREADPGCDVQVADAADMPFPDEHFDLAVASLSLMNMDDMPTVVGEVARVLRPAGHFCFSILHPVNSWGDAGEVSYFQTVHYTEELERGGARMIVHDTHRPLGDYFDALAQAGLLVERVVEPVPDGAYIAAVPEVERWRCHPGFLHVRAVLSG
jgi:SAM-dependent methyltransferase